MCRKPSIYTLHEENKFQHSLGSINFSSNKLKQADRHVIIITCWADNECTFFSTGLSNWFSFTEDSSLYS